MTALCHVAREVRFALVSLVSIDFGESTCKILAHLSQFVSTILRRKTPCKLCLDIYEVLKHLCVLFQMGFEDAYIQWKIKVSHVYQ